MEKELEERELKELELMNENENREFYVYVHIRLDNNTVFYVGKGKGDRAYNLDRGNFHNGVCKEHGCKVEIIKDNLTESQAFRLESKMIKYYVLTLGYGIPIDGYRNFSNNKYLTNFTWGGEGVSGMHHTEETKEKISEKLKGENSPIYGKHLSEETKQKMSEKKKGENNPMYGKKGIYNRSEETKEKMSEKKKGENHPMYGKPSPNRSKVICITTGKTFDSITEASNWYNVAQSSISLCCRGKLYKHAGKLKDGTRLQWKYSEEDDDNESNEYNESK